jgi:hypothetical protein
MTGVDALPEFIETPTFTRLCEALLPDDEYRALQTALIENPEAGDLIPRSGGARKLRWARPGTGKSGGLRTIYYWRSRAGQFWMLLMYPKSAKGNLTDSEKNALRDFIRSLDP